MSDLLEIKKYLEQRKLQFKLIPLNKKAFTVEDVKKAGVREDEIVKTLVLRTVNSQFVAFCVRGVDRLDFKKVRTIFGSKTELAKPEEVLNAVGVPIGAVCPVEIGVPVYVDGKVMSLKNVHLGSGDLKYGLEMNLSSLLEAVDGWLEADLVI